MQYKITEDVIDRVEQILKLTGITEISSSPLGDIKDQKNHNLRFLAYVQATVLIRHGNGGVFGHPLVREYCLTGKLPKECFG